MVGFNYENSKYADVDAKYKTEAHFNQTKKGGTCFKALTWEKWSLFE